jgi:hypothetical protein
MKYFVASETHTDNLSSNCILHGILSNSCSLSKVPHPYSGFGIPIILSRTPVESSSRGSGRHIVRRSVYLYASLLVRRLTLLSTVTYISCSSRLLRLAQTTRSHISCLTHPASRTTHFVVKCETVSGTMMSNKNG